MKKRIWVLLIIICALIIFLNIKITKEVNNPFKVNKNYVLNIEKGENFYKVLNKLEKENIVLNKNFIKLYVKFKKVNLMTKPGKYIISNNTSLEQFLYMINKGNKENFIKVTIPEGYNLEQIGSLLENKGLVSKKKFIEACCKYPNPQYIKINPGNRYPLEGYLFPDTYEFKKGDNANEFIKAMLKRFESILLDVENKSGKKIEDINKVVVIASLIEKEARVDEDRRKISSVIYNRLKKDMKLQIDATVLYALGHHKEIVTIKDTKTQSPYNTYYIKGLPAGPICSPGKESLIAALMPENTDYLFYLYKKDPTKLHYFTNNYEDFKKAMKKYGYN